MAVYPIYMMPNYSSLAFIYLMSCIILPQFHVNTCTVFPILLQYYQYLYSLGNDVTVLPYCYSFINTVTVLPILLRFYLFLYNLASTVPVLPILLQFYQHCSSFINTCTVLPILFQYYQYLYRLTNTFTS